jgi:hypothetical protein
MAQTVKALAGRVIMRFPPPIDKQGSLYVPETSQLRPELGEIVSIGEPLDEKERIIANALYELKRDGKKILVTIMGGVRFWDDTKATAQSKAEWGWLADYRAYRIGELAAFLTEE